MFVLVTYDVNTTTSAGRKRLAKLAKLCCNYGQRVQNSVFECELEQAKFIEVRDQMLKLIDEEHDSLRIYRLGKNHAEKVEEYGKKTCYDPDGVLVL